MHRRTKQRIGWLLSAGIGAAVLGGWLYWHQRPLPAPSVQLQPSTTPATQPAAVLPPVVATTPSTTSPPAAVLPASSDLNVPFTAQAPTANWDAVHEEYCEEASALMVGRYFRNQTVADAADAEAGMNDIASWETDHGIPTTSATATQVAELLHGMYGLSATLVTDPSAEDLKRLVANNHLVIVPAYGRALKNPYFTAPGPVYHMLVLKGYTANDMFVTNDPGIKQGANYQYSTTILLNAIGDWNNGHPETGAHVVIDVSN